MKVLLGLSAVLLSCCWLAGCNGFFVSAANCSTITLSPSSPSLTTGQVQQFTATCSTSSGGSQDVTSLAHWSSSSNSTVCMNGNNTAVAIAPGSATVSAIANNVLGSANVTVTGTALTASNVAISPPTATINVAANQQFTATVNSNAVTNAVTWTSGTPGIATITSTGLATGVSTGQTSITGSLCGLTPSPATLNVQ